MSDSLKKIQKPIEDELRLFKVHFSEFMSSKVLILDRILKYVVKQKSKKIRPILVLLSSKLCGEVNETTYRSATLVELLHTATLVHDDVVDNSHFRRNVLSLNALWKNKIAVLVGDYLLSQGLLLSVRHQEFEQLKVLSEAVDSMSQGELLQIKKNQSLDFDEELYFDITRKKTASLMACCCEMGAISTKATTEQVRNMKKIGEIIGVIFQLRDDLLDFKEKDTGKPFASDLKDNKFTLPLIYALRTSSWFEKRKMMHRAKKKKLSKAKIYGLIEFIRDSGGIDYTKKLMRQYQTEVLQLLQKFPDSPARASFIELLEYICLRNQ